MVIAPDGGVLCLRCTEMITLSPTLPFVNSFSINKSILTHCCIIFFVVNCSQRIICSQMQRGGKEALLLGQNKEITRYHFCSCRSKSCRSPTARGWRLFSRYMEPIRSYCLAKATHCALAALLLSILRSFIISTACATQERLSCAFPRNSSVCAIGT